MGIGLAYSASEKSLLIELIQLNKVVENKRTDASSIHEKNKAWETITETFNMTGDHPKRTVSQVKKCWHNIKTKRKSEITSHKQAVLRTGGGPVVEKLVENPLIDEFANIACEIPGAIDSDTITSRNVTCVTRSDGHLEFNIQSSDDNLSDSNIHNTDAFINAGPSNSFAKKVEVPRQYSNYKKSNLSAEVSSRIERVENQRINDKEIHKLLKEELLLKIENEKELLKRRKVETEIASNDLIFRREKHLTEMDLLKRLN